MLKVNTSLSCIYLTCKIINFVIQMPLAVKYVNIANNPATKNIRIFPVLCILRGTSRHSQLMTLKSQHNTFRPQTI